MINRLHAEFKYPDVHFINGEEMLAESWYLSVDSLHPSTEGHALMGVYLADIIKKHI